MNEGGKISVSIVRFLSSMTKPSCPKRCVTSYRRPGRLHISSMNRIALPISLRKQCKPTKQGSRRMCRTGCRVFGRLLQNRRRSKSRVLDRKWLQENSNTHFHCGLGRGCQPCPTNHLTSPPPDFEAKRIASS